MTLLFLDVDGPLIPFKARPTVASRRPPDEVGNPLLDRLDPADGRRLLALGCDLVWATTWLADANEVVAPRLGLPKLPVVEWPDDDEEPEPGVHWKTAQLVRWSDGRPFAWLDDEITDTDRRWVATHHPAPALLRRVDPFIGLSASDYVAVRTWLGELTAAV
ncbi:HAD domain-containing protein [Asanoa sp. NPDC050611]|uniref:HAD domain-containing protein n=1 Tax=Asanoa sp. NPDC050611 TaxID=3157098 RepID=UPI0034053CA4